MYLIPFSTIIISLVFSLVDRTQPVCFPFHFFFVLKHRVQNIKPVRASVNWRGTERRACSKVESGAPLPSRVRF